MEDIYAPFLDLTFRDAWDRKDIGLICGDFLSRGFCSKFQKENVNVLGWREFAWMEYPFSHVSHSIVLPRNEDFILFRCFKYDSMNCCRIYQDGSVRKVFDSCSSAEGFYPLAKPLFWLGVSPENIRNVSYLSEHDCLEFHFERTRMIGELNFPNSYPPLNISTFMEF